MKSSNQKAKTEGPNIGGGIKAYFNPEGKKDNKQALLTEQERLGLPLPGDASDSDTDEEIDSSDESPEIVENKALSGDDISDDGFQNNVDFSSDKK